MSSTNTAPGGYAFLHRVGYLFAGALIFLPLADIALGLTPVDFSSIRWRVGAVGLVTGASLLPIGGLLLALGIAHVRGHRITQWALATCAGLAGIAFLLALGMFTLDALQLRNDVNPQKLHFYDRATGKGIISQVIMVVALLWMSFGSYRASWAVRKAERATRKNQEPVMARGGELRQPVPAGAPQ